MKIAIFSDIHGNIYAFDKMLESLKDEKLDFSIFCGDICGYYYYQNEIIDILRGMKDLFCVAGNHDRIFLAMLRDNSLALEYETLYGKSNTLLKGIIKKENLEFIKNMPDSYIFDEFKMIVLHGNPWDPLNGYVYPTDSLEKFRGLQYAYVLLGHTHYPMDKTIERVRIINPGSCGQPRDFNMLSYAILNLDSGSIEFRRIEYEADSLAKDVIRYKEKNEYLIEVLKREKAE